MQQNRDGFSSQFGVVAAAAGSAIGLGNIWRFPYVLGENGGGAFFLIYILFILVLGVPMILSELSIGRRSKSNVIGAFKKLAPGTYWHHIGLIGVLAPILILSFYCAVAGWTLEYLFQSIGNGFEGQSAQQLSDMYDTFISSPVKPIVWMGIFLIINAVIVIAGIQKGIEKYTKILMPLLLVIIVILDIRALTTDGAMEGLSFLFTPDFSKITQSTVLEALGQAFFSLSLGMGALVTYGSYIKSRENLVKTTSYVAIADTAIAVLSGIAIFPAVFSFGIEAGAGPGLVFKTLPLVFDQMAGGYIFGIMFFALLVIAALTSSISLLEVVIAFLTEEYHVARKKAVWIVTGIVAITGALCTLSFGALEDVTFAGKTIFTLFEYVSSNVLLPLGGLLMVIFAGWKLPAVDLKDEVNRGGKGRARLFPLFRFIIKYIAPIAIGFVLVNSIINGGE